MNDNDIKLLNKYLTKHFTKNKINSLLNDYTLEELRKYLGEHDIEYFALAYFPKYFDRDFGDFHRELFKEFQYIIDNNGIVEAIGLAREHGKSTISSFLLPIYCLLYNKSPFTLIISATEAISLPFLDMIKDELINNEAVKKDFGITKGDRWNNNEIWVTSKDKSIDACIMIRGIDSSLRGVHYKQHRPVLILCDDLLKEDTAISETKRENIKNTFKSVIIPIGTKFSNIVIIGTILHEDDLVADLLKGKIPGVRTIFKPAIIQWSVREDLWETWEKIYHNLEDINRIENAYQFYLQNENEMLKDTKILWHEYLTYYDLMKKKQLMGERAFLREMQHELRNEAEYPFLNLQYWDVLPNFEDMNIVMVIDPSLAKNKKSDYSAIVTLGRHKKTGQIYVIDGDIRRIKPHDLIKLVSEKIEIYPVNNLGVETVQFQSLLFDDMKKYLMKKHQYVTMTPINTRSNKEVRIMGLENSISNGYIKFNRDNQLFNSQMMAYCGKKSKNDDAPDGLALGVSLLDTGNRALKVLPTHLLF